MREVNSSLKLLFGGVFYLDYLGGCRFLNKWIKDKRGERKAAVFLTEYDRIIIIGMTGNIVIV